MLLAGIPPPVTDGDLLATLALLERLLAAAEQADGPAASSRSWSSRPSPTQADGDTRAPWRTSNVPWLWPSQKATSACSSEGAPMGDLLEHARRPIRGSLRSSARGRLRTTAQSGTWSDDRCWHRTPRASSSR